tara:strand:+ start:21107 stop:31054 length:9948 start_codon:yes stop_codon:yes gene_type:complete
MADNTDDLFTNPTTRAASDRLEASKKQLEGMYPAGKAQAFLDATRPKTGPFGQIKGSGMADGLAEIASGFPDYAPLAGEKGTTGTVQGPDDIQDGDFSDSFARAHSNAWKDVGIGLTAVQGNEDDLMVSLEQKYQRRANGLDVDPELWTAEAKTWSEGAKQFFTGKHRFFDRDYWGNFAGGQLPMLESMAVGTGVGAKTGAMYTAWAGPKALIGAGGGALVGAAGGSGAHVYLQTLGGTLTDAYFMYRQKGFGGREAYEKAREVADVDAAKSGAIASLAVFVAPLRLASGATATAGRATVSGISRAVPRVIWSAPAGEAVKTTIKKQLLQQTLIVQPSLELVDTVTSNVIAKNSYDPARVLHQGSVDAVVGSILFDIPTTGGGMMFQRYKRRQALGPNEDGTPGTDGENTFVYAPAFDPEPDQSAPLVPAPLQLEGPRFQVMPQPDGTFVVRDRNESQVYETGTFLAPETKDQLQSGLDQLVQQLQQLEQRANIAEGQGRPDAAIAKIYEKIREVEAQIEAQQALVDGKPTPSNEETAVDLSMVFDNEADAQAEAEARNQHAASEWASPWFPENKTSRASFVQEQIERLAAKDAELRQTEPEYTGDVKFDNAINFLQWLGEADAIIDRINALPIQERNSQKNQALYADAKERLWLLKSLMDPVRIATRPNKIFTSKGITYRVWLDRNGEAFQPKPGNPNWIRVYDQTNKAKGYRDVSVASGELEDISVPLPTNMLLNDPDHLKRIYEVKRRFDETLQLPPSELRLTDQSDPRAPDASVIQTDVDQQKADFDAANELAEQQKAEREAKEEADNESEARFLERSKEVLERKGAEAEAVSPDVGEAAALSQASRPFAVPAAGPDTILVGTGDVRTIPISQGAVRNDWEVEEAEAEAEDAPAPEAVVDIDTDVDTDTQTAAVKADVPLELLESMDAEELAQADAESAARKEVERIEAFAKEHDLESVYDMARENANQTSTEGTWDQRMAGVIERNKKLAPYNEGKNVLNEDTNMDSLPYLNSIIGSFQTLMEDGTFDSPLTEKNELIPKETYDLYRSQKFGEGIRSIEEAVPKTLEAKTDILIKKYEKAQGNTPTRTGPLVDALVGAVQGKKKPATKKIYVYVKYKGETKFVPHQVFEEAEDAKDSTIMSEVEAEIDDLKQQGHKAKKSKKPFPPNVQYSVRPEPLIERVLAFVPQAQKKRVAKVLQMYSDALGPEMDSVRLMSLAQWLSDVDPSTPAETAALLAQFVNKLDGHVERIIAINTDLDTATILNELSHELVHLAVKLKNLPEAGMIEWYRALPENTFYKQKVNTTDAYKNLPEAKKAEEVLAMVLAEMSTQRYGGRLHRESGFQYLLRQILRMFNELYDTITGTNMVNRFLENIRSYGVDVNPVNPMEEFVKASRDAYAKEAWGDGRAAAREEGESAINPHPAGTTEYRFWNMGRDSILLQNKGHTEQENEVQFSIINDPNPVGKGKIGLVYNAMEESEAPKPTRKVYKLMRLFKSKKGLIYPLFARASTGTRSTEAQAFTMGEWYRAEIQKPNDLAERPGIHSLGLPIFEQGNVIMKADNDIRVWAEVEIPTMKKATQKESDSTAILSNGQREGIRERLIGPNESYNFKTNPNAKVGAAGLWPISGSMKIIRFLGNESIAKILTDAGQKEYIPSQKSLWSDADAAKMTEEALKVSEAVKNATNVEEFIPWSELDPTGPPVNLTEMEQVSVQYSVIPQHRRAQRAKPAGQPQQTVGGTDYRSLDLDKTSASVNALNFNVADVWEEVVADYGPEGKALLDRLAAENNGQEVRPRGNAFWLKSLQLPDRARFWYEISSERFLDVFKKFNNPQFIAKFIDTVAATSVLAGPLDNILRAISVTAEMFQNKGIMTDLTDKGQGAGVNKALSDDRLPGDKTGNFAGTMNYLMGLTDTIPLSTNDRQVAAYFNTNGDVLANAPKTAVDAQGNRVKVPSLYDMLSEFHIRLRDRLNQELLERNPNAEPFETWQLQALGWIAIRAELNAKKGDVSQYDDYDQVIEVAFDRMDKAGINVSARELSPAVLSDPRVPYALRDTLQDFEQRPTATVETLTKNTPVGKAFDVVADILPTLEKTTQYQKTLDGIQRRTLSALKNKGRGEAIVTDLWQGITGSSEKLSRMDIGIGTFEGEPNWNVRLPLKGMNDEHRGVFLSILGLVFQQSAMAAHQLLPARPNRKARDGYTRTYRVFVSTLDRDKIGQNEIAQLDSALGIPLSAHRQANGWTIDFMVGGFEGVTLNRRIITDAINRTDLKDLGDIFISPMDYRAVPGLDYVEAEANEHWLDPQTGAMVQIGYEKQIQNFVEGIHNVAIAEISGLDTRVNVREAKAFFEGDHANLYFFRKFKSGKIERKDVPKSVLKRAEKIRAEHRRRVDNLRKVEAKLLALFGEQELQQQNFLKTVLPKIWDQLSKDQQEALGRPFTPVPEIAAENQTESASELFKNYEEVSREYSILDSKSQAEQRQMMNRLTRGTWNFTNIFTGSAKRVRQLAGNVKSAWTLSNILERDQYGNVDVGEMGYAPEDVNSQIEQMSALYNKEYSDILRGMTEEQKRALPHIMRGRDAYQDKATGKWKIPLPKGFPKAKATQMRKLLDRMWAELSAVYVSQGLTPPPKIKNYFPQRYQLNGTMDGFAKDHVMELFFESVFTGAFTNGRQRARAEEAAKTVVEKIKNEHYQPVWGNNLDLRDDQDIAQQRKGAYSLTSPELRRLINLDPYAEQDVIMPDGSIRTLRLVDFLDNDTGMIMNGYITNMVRRINFANRFGVDGRIVANFVNQYQRDVFNNPLHEGVRVNPRGEIVYYRNKDGSMRLHLGNPVPMTDPNTPRVRGKIDADLIAAGMPPLTGQQRQTIMTLIRGNMGIISTGEFYRTVKEPMNGLKFFGNLSLLGMSAWSSIMEPMIIGSRLGTLPMLYGLGAQIREILRVPVKTVRSIGKTYADGPQPSTRDRWSRFREHYGYDQTDTKEFAKDLGIIFEDMQYVLQNAVEDLTSVRWDKMNNVFFRANLLQPLTEMQQVASLKASIQALDTWAKQARKGNKTAIRNLKEVHAWDYKTNTDLLGKYTKHDPTNTSNAVARAALRQMNRQIIMAPSPGKRPHWMNDPRFMLIAHIKTWVFTFNNTVLQRSWRELIKHGNPSPLIWLAGFGFLSAWAYEQREWVRWGEEGNPYLNRIGLGKDNQAERTMYLAIERGNMAGPLQFAIDMYTGSRLGTLDLGPTLIPTLNVLYRTVGGTGRTLNAPFTDDPRKEFRAGLNDLTRGLPMINAMGQYRIDAINTISGYTPRGSGSSSTRGRALGGRRKIKRRKLGSR